jgi:hypothetical protein
LLEEPGKLDTLVERAVSYLKERQERALLDYKIGSYERYDCHQETGQLIFSSSGRPQVIADIVWAGSVSTLSNTWLWSWANPSILESCKERIREVRHYGEEHGLMKLAVARWSAIEQDGWDMTAIASLLLGAVGAYRAPSTNHATFLIMTRLSWAQ